MVVEINKPLKKLDRATLITLCTIDVHARDVLGRLIDDRVEDATCFQWQSQLRYLQHERSKKCQVRALCAGKNIVFDLHCCMSFRARMVAHKL